MPLAIPFQKISSLAVHWDEVPSTPLPDLPTLSMGKNTSRQETAPANSLQGSDFNLQGGNVGNLIQPASKGEAVQNPAPLPISWDQVSNKPLEVIGPKYRDYVPDYNPSGVQLLIDQLDKNPHGIDKIMTLAAKGLLSLGTPLLDAAKDLADIYYESQVANQVTGVPATTRLIPVAPGINVNVPVPAVPQTLPPEALGKTGAFDKTIPQYLGDVIGAGLIIGGLSPFGKLSGAAIDAIDTTSGKALMTSISRQFGKNLIANLPFAGSIVLSEGQDPFKEPLMFGANTVMNAAFMSALNTTLESALPVTKFGFDKTKEFQFNLERELVDKGISPERAHLLATQGGFAGDVVNGEPPPESTGQKERKFLTSLKENAPTAEMFKDIENNYDIKPNQPTIDQARTLIATDPERARELAMSPEMTTEAISTGIELLKNDVQAGDVAKANELAANLAAKGTETGRTTQIFNTLKDRTTPENALVAAHRVVNDVGGDEKVKIKVDEASTKINEELNKINTDAVEKVIQNIPDLKRADELAKIAKQAIEPTPPEVQLAKKIASDITKKAKVPDPVKEMVNILFKIAKEDLPAKAKIPPKTQMELLTQTMADHDTAKEIWTKAQPIIREKFKDNPEALKTLEKYLDRTMLSGRTQHGELPLPKKMVTGAVKETLKSQSVNLADLVREHYRTVDTARESLVTKMVRDAGVDPHEAAQLQSRIRAHFKELTDAKKQQVLDAILKERKIKPKDKVQRIIELSNLGAFDHASVRGIVAEKLGIGNIDSPTAKLIIDQANEIQTLPKGSTERNYKTNLLLKRISDLKPSSFVEKYSALFKAGIFSSIRTKEIKMASEFTKLVYSHMDDVVATGLDNLRTVVFGTPRTKSASLGGLVTEVKSIPQGWQSTKDYFKTGVGNGIYHDLRMKLKEVGVDVRGDFYGSEAKFDNPILQAWTKITLRGLGAETEIYKGMAAWASLYEQARVIGLNEGLKGEALTTRIGEILKNPTDDMAANAIDLAEERSFQKGNLVSNAIQSGKQTLKRMGEEAPVGSKQRTAANLAYGASETILPVVTIATNIGKDVYAHTPLGFLTTLLSQEGRDWKGKAFVESLSKSLTGTGVIALGYYLSTQGKMTGNYPDTAAERDKWRAENITPNSVLINGHYVQVGRALGPFGELMGIGADIEKLNHDNSGIDLAVQIGISGVKKLAEQPFLMGVSSVTQALSQPEQKGPIIAEATIGSAIPNIITTLAKSIDPTQRNPKGIIQNIESRLPFISKQVPARIDVFGQSPERSRTDFIDPFQTRKAKPSSIIDEATNVGVDLTEASDRMFNTKLDNKEYEEYAKVEGLFLWQGLHDMIDSDEYQGLSDIDKKSAMESTVQNIRTDVKNAMFSNLMIERYALPENTDPERLTNIVNDLNKDKGFKTSSKEEQKQLIEYFLNH